MSKAAYRLDDLERLREVALGQVALANTALAAGKVHDLRKAAKRLRAVLRLVKADVGRKRAKKDDRILRDLARAAGDARDAEVIAALFEELVACLEAPAEEVEAVRAELADAVVRSSGDRDDATIAEALDRLERRVRRWRATPAGVRAGVDQTMRRCQRRMHVAQRTLSAEDLHEWRKEVKYHWHHCELLGDEPRAKQVHALSDALGDEHDLVVLVERAGDLTEIVEMVAPRRLALQERALELSRQLLTTD